ncbi:MAG: ATP-grasp domain-containing protein [Pseudomonadota bacterium]|nr:ATP-grasp domain-containing protein [Pseudomonadota bacterium]
MTTRRVFLFEYLSASAGERGDGAATELHTEGLAMREAMRADLVALPNVDLSVAVDRLAPSFDADNRASTQPVCALVGESLLDFVARQAKLHDLVWVVAPETGGLLAALNEAVSPQRWLGCAGEAIRLASSKQSTLSRLHERGIATPRDFMNDASVRHWVVKPDDGAGSVNTRRHGDRAAALIDWQRREQRGETATLEPWVDGDALSLSLLVHDDGAELLAVNRQRLAIDGDGSVSLIEVDIAAADIDAAQQHALEQTARDVSAALPGLAGWVGIDLVWHAGRGPVVVEVNPRVTSAYVGMSAALGRNLAEEILAAHEVTHPQPAGSDAAH